jgi:hypothetical protein
MEMKVVDGCEPVALSLQDTPFPEEDPVLSSFIRREILPQADVFLVCFSVVRPCSFENVKCKV